MGIHRQDRGMSIAHQLMHGIASDNVVGKCLIVVRWLLLCKFRMLFVLNFSCITIVLLVFFLSPFVCRRTYVITLCRQYQRSSDHDKDLVSNTGNDSGDDSL